MTGMVFFFRLYIYREREIERDISRIMRAIFFRALLFFIVVWNRLIDLLHKSHNAPVSHPRIQHSVTEMCARVHISVTKYCIMGNSSNALWDLWDESILPVSLKNWNDMGKYISMVSCKKAPFPPDRALLAGYPLYKTPQELNIKPQQSKTQKKRVHILWYIVGMLSILVHWTVQNKIAITRNISMCYFISSGPSDAYMRQ